VEPPPKPPGEGSLVLYKNRPARVRRVADRLDIELAGGETVKVRPKDVVLLHPGPLRSLDELAPQTGEVQAAWEVLAGGQTTLPELAELAYGAYTPATAWAAWQLVADGLYFSPKGTYPHRGPTGGHGEPDQLIANTPQQVAHKQAARDAEAAQKQAWEAFVKRARAGQVAPGDDRYLKEVAALALKQGAHSRLMRELGREESPENAHALLLELSYWDETVNPYPQRLGLSTSPPALELPPLPDEARADLTHLPALAIDDEGTTTPDDALSLEGDRLWVHVADAAALVHPDDPVDLEARARGASLHLPESVVPMLPWSATQRLGLGLAEVSPALSFGLDLDPDGQAIRLEVLPSWVRVTRLTYAEAEARLGEEPMRSFDRLARVYQARRRAHGALMMDFPEVQVSVQAGEIRLRPLPPLKSRTAVQEAMLMAGEAVARFAMEREIPIPYAVQEPPEPGGPTGESLSLSEMFALRRTLKRSQYRSLPAPHAGMGLAAYVQATSPLRRYPDLVAHQQIRAYLRGGQPLETQDVLERIGAVEAVIGSVRQAEHLSDRHWTLVYLLQQPGWHGQGILVERRGLSAKVLIPELGLEVSLRLPHPAPLDSSLPLGLRDVNLAQLEAYFALT
jgi:exoribonuclease-2